ncbi:hypothetical protein DP148_26240 [Salmonella enterica subsp. enterica serovar Typhimurium]|nr:hypothetical protein DP148_26240 [Salmonella enterica subsp. enterica serovar Typhimurium]
MVTFSGFVIMIMKSGTPILDIIKNNWKDAAEIVCTVGVMIAVLQYPVYCFACYGAFHFFKKVFIAVDAKHEKRQRDDDGAKNRIVESDDGGDASGGDAGNDIDKTGRKPNGTLLSIRVENTSRQHHTAEK